MPDIRAFAGKSPLNARLSGRAALLAAITLTPTVTLAQQAMLEEITVYAQKREQSLQDVAASVSTISGEDLDVRNIDNPFDFSDRIPGLVATEVQGYRRTFFQRC